MVSLTFLALAVIAVVLVVATTRGHDGGRTGASTRSLGENLARWTAAGLLSEDQARAIRAHEHADRVSAPHAAPAVGVPPGRAPFGRQTVPRQPRRVPVVAEALGYLGGVLVVVGVVLVVARYWPDMATAGRLASSGGAAAALLVAGLLVTAETDPALARLRAFVLLASTAATMLFVGVLVADGYGTDAPQTIVLGCAAAASVHSGLLWWGRDRPLQQITFLAGLTVSAGAAFIDFLSEGPAGLAVWVIGGLLMIAGVRRLGPRPLLTEAAGAIATVVGAAITIGGWQAFGLALVVATAFALLAVATVPGLAPARADHTITAIVGGLALLESAPPALAYFSRDAGTITGLATWTLGAALFAIGARDLVRAPIVAEGLGGVALIGGAALTGVEAHGFAPIFGIVTAIGMVAIGMLPGQVLMSVFGAVGLLINVPWAIGWFFPGEGRAPLLVLVSGALILAVAVLLGRMGGRFRRELGTPRHHPNPTAA